MTSKNIYLAHGISSSHRCLTSWIPVLSTSTLLQTIIPGHSWILSSHIFITSSIIKYKILMSNHSLHSFQLLTSLLAVCSILSSLCLWILNSSLTLLLFSLLQLFPVNPSLSGESYLHFICSLFDFYFCLDGFPGLLI